jgi:hypothetical protein
MINRSDIQGFEQSVSALPAAMSRDVIRMQKTPLVEPSQAWCNLAVKHPYLIRHPETGRYHILFDGLKTTDDVWSNTALGIADALTDDPLGPYQMYSGNPIADKTIGGPDAEGLLTASVIFRADLTPKVWHIYYTGMSWVGGLRRSQVCRLTSAGVDIHGPYTKDGVFITYGVPGSYDSQAAMRPSILSAGNAGYEMLYTAITTAPAVTTIVRATATAAEVWTKDRIVQYPRMFSADQTFAGHQLLQYLGNDIHVWTSTPSDLNKMYHHINIAFSSDGNRRVWGRPPYPLPISIANFWEGPSMRWQSNLLHPHFSLIDTDAIMLYTREYQGTKGYYHDVTIPAVICGATIDRSILVPNNYPELSYDIWYLLTVPAAGQATEYTEVGGFRKKEFSLFSPTIGGVAYIQVDVDGVTDVAGAIIWRNLPPKDVIPGVMCRLSTEMNVHKIRLFFDPDAVDAPNTMCQLVVGK